MNFTRDELAIATAEFYCYLEQQINASAPEIPALVPAPIKIERVGFTRNASNTPYIVYRIADRRCSTFIARRWFLELAQKLLKLRHSVDARIAGVVSSPDFGLTVKFKVNGLLQDKYIPRAYVNKFFERYNTVALEHTQPQNDCACNDLFDMCLHQIAEVLCPQLEDCLPKTNTEQVTNSKPAPPVHTRILSRYNPYARVGEKISIHGVKCELSAGCQKVAPGAANRR
jgi:hypothetical protein